jgi:hypothetical protein
MFKNKYLKYKNKYLELKNQIAGATSSDKKVMTVEPGTGESSNKKITMPVPGSVSNMIPIKGLCQGPGSTWYDDCSCAFCSIGACRTCKYDGTEQLCSNCIDNCYCTDTVKCPICVYKEEFETKEKEEKIKDEVNDLYDDRSIDYENKLFNPKK